MPFLDQSVDLTLIINYFLFIIISLNTRHKHFVAAISFAIVAARRMRESDFLVKVARQTEQCVNYGMHT